MKQMREIFASLRFSCVVALKMSDEWRDAVSIRFAEREIGTSSFGLRSLAALIDDHTADKRPCWCLPLAFENDRDVTLSCTGGRLSVVQRTTRHAKRSKICIRTGWSLYAALATSARPNELSPPFDYANVRVVTDDVHRAA